MSHVPKKNMRLIVTVAVFAIALICIFAAVNAGRGTAAVAVDQDLTIPIKDITATAKFYPIDIEGTRLEVLAVKAPDGSLRTAFNICQSCFDSGLGYYKQEGDVLVCQNCGAQFRMDQVGVLAGGCNPVPILPENRITNETAIIIPQAFLTKAKFIFANWKIEY
jgi:uncharacterized membrane protein